MPDLAVRIAFATALATVGCASGPTALYEGPPRDRSQIAVIRRSGARADLVVLRIDDRDTRGYEWHVAPGRHRAWVKLIQYGTAMNVEFSAWTYCRIEFDAEAGEQYRVVSENAQRTGADTEVTLGTRIVDAGGAIVGTPEECTDRSPRFD